MPGDLDWRSESTAGLVAATSTEIARDALGLRGTGENAPTRGPPATAATVAREATIILERRGEGDILARAFLSVLFLLRRISLAPWLALGSAGVPFLPFVLMIDCLVLQIMVKLASIVDGRVWDPARRAVEKRMGLMAAADGLDGGYLALAYVGSDGTYFTGGAR
jgi:hypothetical protein